MYWTTFVRREELEGGRTFVHGTSRLNLTAGDIAAFVEPRDASLAFGFRALDAGDPFEKSFPVWMATLRRRQGDDAIVESLQRVFTQLADEGSLVRVLVELYRHAHALGFARLYLAPGLFQEPLLAPALKKVTEAVGRPVELVATTGLVSLVLGPLTAAE
jgi:hypothetical protein